TEELLLRLEAYVSAMLAVERAEASSLFDASGLYSAAGLLQRSLELASLSERHGVPLSCAVFRAPAGGDGIAQAFKQEGRASDAIGRTGVQEFAVFAFGTDGAGAARPTRRLGELGAKRAGFTQPRASGISPSEPSAASRIDPQALLARARQAAPAP